MQYAPGRLLSPIASGGGPAGLDISFLGPTAATLDPRITFSRAGMAWRYDTTGTLTTAAHNLVTNSQDFENSAWAKNNCAVTGNVVAEPLAGTITADLVTGTTTTVSTTQNITIPSGAKVAIAVYAKAGNVSWMRLRVQGGAETAATWFNLSTGALGAAPVPTANILISGQTITAAGSGWYRVSAVFTTTGFTTLSVGAGPTAADVGTGVSGDTLYLWGFQAEIHTTSRSYLTTSTKNMAGFSEQFDNAAWTKAACTVTANAVAAPDGTVTADKLVDTATTANHEANTTAAVISGTAYTFSCYFKQAERRYARMVASTGFFGASNVTWFDLQTGTVGTNQGATTASIVDVGGGWYRCSYTRTATGSGTSSFYVSMSTADGTSSYAGVLTEGLYIWGAMVGSSGSLDTYSPNVAAAPSSAAFYGARFDHDPGSVVTNGLVYSGQHDNWFADNATVTADVVANPLDGTANADKVTEGSGSNFYGSHQTATIQTNVPITYSFYAKAAGRSFLRLLVLTGGGDGFQCFFNLSNGTLGTASNSGAGTGAAGTIASVGGDWFRCSVTGTPATTNSGSLSAYVRLADVDGATSYTGNGTSGIYLYGGQVERGATATTLITTTSAAASGPATARGLLIEEARTNQMPGLMTGGTYWQGAATTIASGATAPDGTTNGYTLTQSAGGTQTYGASPLVGVFGTMTAGQAVTASIFAKAGTCSFLRMFLTDNNTPTVSSVVWFNLSAGTIGTTSNSGSPTSTSSAIQSVGNGWYRCSITAILSTATTCTILVRMASADAATTDVGSKTFSVWAPQLEVGGFVSSPILTTTAAVTRAIDLASVTILGNWFNAATGTLHAEASSAGVNTSSTALALHDGTGNNLISVRFRNSSPFVSASLTAGGVAQITTAGASSYTAGAVAKMALAYLTDDVVTCFGGTIGVTDTLATLPAVTTLQLGARNGGSEPLNGYVRRIKVYDRKLGPAVLQMITS